MRTTKKIVASVLVPEEQIKHGSDQVSEKLVKFLRRSGAIHWTVDFREEKREEEKRSLDYYYPHLIEVRGEMEVVVDEE